MWVPVRRRRDVSLDGVLTSEAWRRHVRKEQSFLIALAAARSGSGHLIVELVMPFVAGRSLGAAPFYAY